MKVGPHNSLSLAKVTVSHNFKPYFSVRKNSTWAPYEQDKMVYEMFIFRREKTCVRMAIDCADRTMKALADFKRTISRN